MIVLKQLQMIRSIWVMYKPTSIENIRQRKDMLVILKEEIDALRLTLTLENEQEVA